MMLSRSLPSGVLASLVLAFLAPPWAAAQAPQPQQRRPPSPESTVRSIEVAPDHKVTFRIYAPKASEVTVAGDFGNGKLTKDDNGIWSTTVGPLVPDFYTYTFRIDGVRTIDPRNPMIKPGLGSVDSMFLVPGPEAAFEEHKEVPHGQVRVDWYRSKTLGVERSLRVYTPPGYDGTSEHYPVFYLLHGAGDDDAGWSTVGRAGFILDNLLAEKKALPMIVVMPNGSLPRPANMPAFTPGAPPSPEARAAMQAAQNRFTDELLKDIVPFVEKHYRALPGRENRAIAGLSMGGGQTLRVLLAHPGEFGYVALFSAATFRGNAEEFEKQNESFFKDAEKLNKTLKLLSISCGDKDFLIEGSRALAELLEKHGIKHELHVSGGGHTWINWRHYLNELAPKLFH
jgi:enterochelin esterase family protein